MEYEVYLEKQDEVSIVWSMRFSYTWKGSMR